MYVETMHILGTKYAHVSENELFFLLIVDVRCV